MLDATLAILDADVITLNHRRTKAQAIAVYRDRIIAVGSNNEIVQYIGGKTKVLNAQNKTVVPGLIDCHVHMTGFGQHLRTLELRNSRSIREIQRKLKRYAVKNPNREWIIGGRWDQEKFSEKRYPTRWDLDRAISDRPVFLARVCGHIGVANTKALELSGITEKTVITHGKVVLDEKTNQPNGILFENAMVLVWKVVPRLSDVELQESCALACRNAVKAGLTCVHWIVGSTKEIRVLQELCSRHELPLRVYLGIPVEVVDQLTSTGFLTGFGNDMLKIGFIKILADGSLGGHTAALLKPYVDKPETRGMMLYTRRQLSRLIMKVHEAGLQLAVHAIGDRTIGTVLKAFEQALRKHPRRDHRHRIEHCSVLNSELVRRIKRSNLIASVQPHFIESDFWVISRVGRNRARWVYPLRTLFKEGPMVIAGSDCPVEPIDPILGIWAATARKTFKEEAIRAEDALRAYTSNAAFASFDEKNRGSVETGKLADLTILTKNPLTVEPDEIRRIQVEATVVNGEIAYSRKSVRITSKSALRRQMSK